MGTRFELVLPGENPERLRPAGEAALEAIEEAHRSFTRFEPGSLLHHLRRITPAWVVVDQDSFALFSDALEIWRASGGAFDPTVPAGRMRALELDPGRQAVRLTDSSVLLDLGGIAKGHALDLAAGTLRAAGVSSAFLQGGTSSAIALGSPPDAVGWRVALSTAPVGSVLVLRDEAMACSAAWRGNPYPTLDPKTAAPVRRRARIVVVGPSARRADAWATVGLVRGAKFVANVCAGEGYRVIDSTLPRMAAVA